MQAAQRLGGRVMMGATDIPGAGREAVLADPQGAAFALYSPPSGSQPASGSSSGSEAFSWHELTTTDAVAELLKTECAGERMASRTDRSTGFSEVPGYFGEADSY